MTGIPPPPAPYNVSLGPSSPFFVYSPFRDTNVTQGWNASYTTAGPVPEPPADGVAFRRTQARGSSVSVTFEGTGLYLCFTSGGASFALTLDGAIVQTTTSAANESACAQAKGRADTLLYARGLEYGSHSALLQVAPSSAELEHEFRFFGGALEIGVQTGGKIVDDSRMIDDQDPGWVLSPGRGDGRWDTEIVNGLFNVTSTFECNYGNSQTATYTFSGAGAAVLFGEVSPVAHGFSVQVDDLAPVNLDATSRWHDGTAAYFITGALDPSKEHRITVRNFNSDMPDCNSDRLCCVAIDALQLLRAGKDDLPVPPGSSDNSKSSQDPGGGEQVIPHPHDHTSSRKVNKSAIAGGVVGALVAVILMALLAVFLRRRREHRNKAPNEYPSTTQDLAQVHPAVQSHSYDGDSHDHLTPYTRMNNTSIGFSGPNAASGQGKDEDRPVPTSKLSVSDSQTLQYSSVQSAPIIVRVAGPADGAIAHGAPRLAQEDLEQVLAFVAQRMDGHGPVVGEHEPELPQYRGLY